jgi:hypothetical protein
LGALFGADRKINHQDKLSRQLLEKPEGKDKILALSFLVQEQSDREYVSAKIFPADKGRISGSHKNFHGSFAIKMLGAVIFTLPCVDFDNSL